MNYNWKKIITEKVKNDIYNKLVNLLSNVAPIPEGYNMQVVLYPSGEIYELIVSQNNFSADIWDGHAIEIVTIPYNMFVADGEEPDYDWIRDQAIWCIDELEKYVNEKGDVIYE